MKPAVLPTDRPAVATLWTCQAACGGRLMCRYARLPLPYVYRHYGGGEWCGGAGTGHVSDRGGVGHAGGTWGLRLAASEVVLTTITLPHASFGPLKIAI
jgi:hypothetical protein